MTNSSSPALPMPSRCSRRAAAIGQRSRQTVLCDQYVARVGARCGHSHRDFPDPGVANAIAVRLTEATVSCFLESGLRRWGFVTVHRFDAGGGVLRRGSSHRLVWLVSRALGAVVLVRVRRVLLSVLVLVLVLALVVMLILVLVVVFVLV